jgi:hypothetical protein
MIRYPGGVYFLTGIPTRYSCKFGGSRILFSILTLRQLDVLTYFEQYIQYEF